MMQWQKTEQGNGVQVKCKETEVTAIKHEDKMMGPRARNHDTLYRNDEGVVKVVRYGVDLNDAVALRMIWDGRGSHFVVLFLLA
jgi:hypothetical protein